MNKRFISLMLLFLFTMGMAVPANANCEAADFLPINIEDLEVLDENSGEVSLDKETLSNTSGSYNMFRNVAIPSGLSESYYRVGISGNFYFTRSSGQVGGFAFGGGVVMNSDKNPYQ